MKNIEVTTSQNVTILYTLATVWDRAFALFLDLLIMGLIFLILLLILYIVLPSISDVAVYVTIIPFLAFYSLSFEQFNNGQSPGKRALKLRVIRMDGEKVLFFDYFMRWIFRGFDIYFSLGGIAVLSVISSRYSQRLGDVLANTVVVKIDKSERMQLVNLLKLNKMENYKVTYPQVVKIPEETMLIIKETLTKKRQLNNAAHGEAFELLVKKMEAQLNIKSPQNKESFLKTILSDYIVLTR